MHFIYISIGKLLLGNLEFLQVKLVEWIYVIWKNIILSRFGVGFLWQKLNLQNLSVQTHAGVEVFVWSCGGKEMCVQTQYVQTVVALAHIKEYGILVIWRWFIILNLNLNTFNNFTMHIASSFLEFWYYTTSSVHEDGSKNALQNYSHSHLFCERKRLLVVFKWVKEDWIQNCIGMIW